MDDQVVYIGSVKRRVVKLRAWLEVNGLPFQEISLSKQGISKPQILELSARSNGIDSLVSRRSKAFQAPDIDFDGVVEGSGGPFCRASSDFLPRPIIWMIVVCYLV